MACEKIRNAHNNLIKSNFYFNKNVAVSVDDVNKIKFTNRAKYINGSLGYSKSKISFSADDFTYKEDYKESFLVTGFTCEDITIQGELVVIIVTQNDIKHSSYFKYKEDKLIPLKSTAEVDVGMFFFSWYIKNMESYSNFKLI